MSIGLRSLISPLFRPIEIYDSSKIRQKDCKKPNFDLQYQKIQLKIFSLLGQVKFNPRVMERNLAPHEEVGLNCKTYVDKLKRNKVSQSKINL